MKATVQTLNVPPAISAVPVAEKSLASVLSELFKLRLTTLVLLTTLVGFYLGTLGPVSYGLMISTILGTASSAQNLGPLSALGVAGYIALAGLWASPVSGASMNPARSLGPALVSGDLHDWWIYLIAPLVGALAAVMAALVLRGPGGDPGGIRAAQGALDTASHPPTSSGPPDR